jgi:hypothetical protein
MKAALQPRYRSSAMVLSAGLLLTLIGASLAPAAQASSIDWSAAVQKTQPQVIKWRRDFHAHPELSNREKRTAQIVAEHLRALGMEVRTGIAHTGVVGLLRGASPGKTVALRADMDALPVTEQTDVPFKSTVTTQFRGENVGVMHACGHDAHTAMLMAWRRSSPAIALTGTGRCCSSFNRRKKARLKASVAGRD